MFCRFSFFTLFFVFTYINILFPTDFLLYIDKHFISHLQRPRQTIASRRKMLPVSPMINPKKATRCPPHLLHGENIPASDTFALDSSPTESGRKRWTLEPYRSRMLQALNLVDKGYSKQKACNICKVLKLWNFFILVCVCNYSGHFYL